MHKRDKYTVGLVQMGMSPDLATNRERAVALADQAAAQGARLICLPELFCSQYFCQREAAELFDLAESIPGPSTEALARVARSRRVWIVVPLFERRAPGLYHNSAVLLDAEGQVAGLYRKMHIPDDPSY